MSAEQQDPTGTGTGSRRPVDRRTALTALGAVGAVGMGLAGTVAARAATIGHVNAGTRPSVTTATTAACVLTPEETDGPYYLDYELVRCDITEGYPGVPLQLAVTVIDTSTCAPLPGAALDVWPCNALGEYSGYTSLGIGGSGGSTGPAPTASPTATPTGTPTGGGTGHTDPTDKLTFLRGASLKDPTGLFNAGFGGGTRRAIDIRQGETVDAAAFKALVREAVALNIAEQRPKRR